MPTSAISVCRPLSLVLCLSYVTMKCVHDSIPVHTATPTTIHYSDIQGDNPARMRRGERSVQETNDTLVQEKEQFKPLRIYTHFVRSTSLSQDIHDTMTEAVQKSVQRISSVLSVIPVPGPLLLSRSEACLLVLSSGVNKGRCSRLKKRIKGEHCLGVLKIPREHLAELSVYNSTHPDPVRTPFKAGAGVDGADVILYVVSTATRLCLAYNQSVMAYASHCRVDHNGRPIAGLINFCPYGLMRRTPSPHSLYTTALHEILHVLGFSFKLFKTFPKCQDGICRNPVHTIRGQDRLMLPAVVNATRTHFDCHTLSDFGGPLDMRTSGVTSHWDAHWMHTSLMTSMEDFTSNILLDPLTLAVFEDSGWYQVNISQADTFLWGKGGGCSFADPDQCLQNSADFCSDNSSGCHFLLHDKATCNAVKTGSHCGIYTSSPQVSCRHKSAGQTTQLDFPEVVSPASRCFLSSITKNSSQAASGDFVGQCLERRCSDSGTVSFRLPGGQWTSCPAGQTIQVSASGVQGEIQCPRSTEIVCQDFLSPHLLTTSTPMPPDITTPVKQLVTRVDRGHELPAVTVSNSGHRHKVTVLCAGCSSWFLGIVSCLFVPCLINTGYI